MAADSVTGMAHDVRMHPDQVVTGLSVRQGGFVRRDQALQVGLSRSQIAQRLKDGRWRRVGKYGYRLVEMPGAVDRARAAVVGLPGAVVSHETAAELHGMPRVPRDLAVVSVHSQTTHVFPGVVVRRNHDLEDSDIGWIDDLPVTTVARTVVDLAAVLSPRHLAAVVDEAIAAGLVEVDEIVAVLDRVARRGKPGVSVLREVLDDRKSGPPRGTSLERAGAQVLINAGLGEPEYEFAIPWDRERRFDAAYPEHKLAIEWDSIRWHSQREAMQRDRARDQQAVLHGWLVLRFTWKDVKERPEHVVATVRAALANRGL